MSEEKPENAQEPRVADTMEAAAGMTGWPLGFIEKLKRIGCSAFRGGRIYLDELDRYIEENPNVEKWADEFEEADKINIEIGRERLRKIRFQNDVEQGRYIAKEALSPALLKLGIDLSTYLRSQLEDILPERIEGKSAADIRVITRGVVDEIFSRFHRGTAHWTNRPAA